MAVKNKYGQELTSGTVVTYNVLDETPALQMIKPLQKFLRTSQLIISDYCGHLELRWEYGEHLKNANVTLLDAETAYILELVPDYSEVD